MDKVVGTKIGPYRIVRMLGEGGMGTVWEATHEGLQKRVAIKTLHASVAQQGEAVTRFLREGQAAARIRHRHIVDVTDVGVNEGTPYLVMEYLDGESLAAAMERGPMSAHTVVGIALPALDALYTAHQAGVIHRDLKPDNIFLRRGTTEALDPVVLDFGISKIEGGDVRLTRTTALMGTPFYMSPEQARGAKNVDARSDQFALGLVLFEAVVGRRAVEGDSVLEVVHKIALLDFPRISTLQTGAPPGLCAVIERMLEADPARRFPDMRDVGRSLLPYADSTTRAVWSGVLGEVTGQIVTTTPSYPSTMMGPVPAANPAPGTISQMSRESFVAPPARKRSWAGPLMALGGLSIAGAAGLFFVHPWAPDEMVSTSLAAPTVAAAPPPPTEAVVAIESMSLHLGAVPASARFSLDGSDLGTGPITQTVPRDGVPHVLIVSATGYVPQRIQFVDVAPVDDIALDRVPRNHHGPVLPRSSVMTAAGLVTADPVVAPPRVAPPTSVVVAADSVRPPPTTTAPVAHPADDTVATDSSAHRPPTTHSRLATDLRRPGGDPPDDTTAGANGSVIMR